MVLGFLLEKSFLESSHLVRKSTFIFFNGVNIWTATLVFVDKSPEGMVQDKHSLPFYWGKLKKSYTFWVTVYLSGTDSSLNLHRSLMFPA